MPKGADLDGSRRKFLTAAGTVATALVAGCAGEDQLTDEGGTDAPDGESGDGSGGDGSGGDGSDGDGSGGDGDDDDSDSSMEETAAAASLSLSIPEASNFDPVQIKGDGSVTVSNHVFDGLFTLPQDTLEPTGKLVDSYTVSDDGRTYTFELKQGVEFHDGTELTASDVVYSWERLAASDNSQESGAILDSPFILAHETTTETVDGEEQELYKPGTLGVEAVDEYTVETTLETAFFDSLFWFAYGSLSPVPEGIVGDVEGYDGEMEYPEFSSQSPVGTGPYEIDEVDTGTNISLSAFDGYYGEAPGPDGIEMQVVQSADTRYQRAINQEVHVFELPNSRFDPSKVTIDERLELGGTVGTYGELENGETVNYATWDEAYSAYFIINCQRVDRPIRRAMAYAVNQQNFVEQAFRGVGKPAYHYTPPSVFPGGQDAYDQHAKENYPYGYNEARVDDARAVMEEAGYSDGNPASITLTVYNDRNPDAYSQIAELMRTKFNSVHIEMEIEQAPFGTIIDQAISGNLDIFSLGNGLEYPSPADTLQYAYPTDSNFSRWEGTEAAERALEGWNQVQENLGTSEADQQARNEAFLQMEEAAWEDAPVLFNYHPRGQRWWYDEADVPVRPSGFHTEHYGNVQL